ncbi:alpha/beta hydrolase family protein [Eilatimonas milleporae]|uniref:Dipeptidyl aminopeptidase/acylaminoacyl peptidase n=1 Tax=Eilatimonas milleporae TaxID=911205 RepID=A0A3M0CPA0_9PROT|nr:prolyl oligopeptidase family serine peptidase [Eilatimonas milleporae]RMB08709.1 dipeptidyl aminopeptidase/acylaminoacyl peptidase [Eilatimonas milleporae]
MRSLIVFISVLIVIMSRQVVAAGNVDKLAGLFAQTPSIWSMTLSPNGDGVSFIIKESGEEVPRLIVADIVDGQLHVRLSLQRDDHRFKWVQWANNNRLLVGISSGLKYGGRVYRNAVSRMIAIDRNGDNTKMLASQKRKIKALKNDDVLHLLPADPQHILIGQASSIFDPEASVYKVNIYTGDMERILTGPRKAHVSDWYADHSGVVKLGFGEDNRGRGRMIIRVGETDDWIELEKNELFEDGRFKIFNFTDDPRHLYVMSSYATGKLALYKFDIEAGELAGKVFEHERYDVHGLIRARSDGRPLAVTYIADKLEYEYLDPIFARTRRSLEKALGGLPFRILSTSMDELRYLVEVQGPTDPGMVYFFDRAEKTLTPLFSYYADIEPEQLHPMQAVSFEARDGLEIPGYITLPKNHDPGRPGAAVILPHNGPQAQRNMVGWDYEGQFLASLGYVVFQPNYRGSTGYGERFRLLGAGEWGRAMQDDLADAAAWLSRTGYAHADRICIVGFYSYSGYASLTGATRDAGSYRCSAAWAPVSDIRLMLKDSESWNDDTLFYDRVMGDLEKKAYASISPLHMVDRLKAPVLLIHGSEDEEVSVKHAREFAKAARKAGKQVKYIELEGVGHSRGQEAIRHRWLRELGHFLLEYNPAHLSEGDAEMASR